MDGKFASGQTTTAPAPKRRGVNGKNELIVGFEIKSFCGAIRLVAVAANIKVQGKF